MKGHNKPQSTKTRKPFLRCGQGIARFGLDPRRVRLKNRKEVLKDNSFGKKPFPASKPRNNAEVSRCGGGGGGGVRGGPLRNVVRVRKVAKGIQRADHEDDNFEQNNAGVDRCGGELGIVPLRNVVRKVAMGIQRADHADDRRRADHEDDNFEQNNAKVDRCGGGRGVGDVVRKVARGIQRADHEEDNFNSDRMEVNYCRSVV